MPALVLRLGDIREHWMFLSNFYKMLVAGSYWEQAVQRAEWDLALEQVARRAGAFSLVSPSAHSPVSPGLAPPCAACRPG